MTSRLQEAKRRLEEMENNSNRIEEEYQREIKLTFRDRLGKEGIAKLRTMQKEYLERYLKKYYREHLADFENIFNDYFESLLDEKVKNMIEYCNIKLGVVIRDPIS